MSTVVVVLASLIKLPSSSAIMVSRKGAFERTIWFRGTSFFLTFNSPEEHNLSNLSLNHYSTVYLITCLRFHKEEGGEWIVIDHDDVMNITRISLIAVFSFNSQHNFTLVETIQFNSSLKYFGWKIRLIYYFKFVGYGRDGRSPNEKGRGILNIHNKNVDDHFHHVASV